MTEKTNSITLNNFIEGTKEVTINGQKYYITTYLCDNIPTMYVSKHKWNGKLTIEQCSSDKEGYDSNIKGRYLSRGNILSVYEPDEPDWNKWYYLFCKKDSKICKTVVPLGFE